MFFYDCRGRGDFGEDILSLIVGSVLTNGSNNVRCRYVKTVNRNNELCQEFYYADSNLKIQINNLFNTSFYGSVPWDLFGAEASRLEKNVFKIYTKYYSTF